MTGGPDPSMPSQDLVERGLACGCHRATARDVPEDEQPGQDRATKSVIDLRRARQRARSTVRSIMQAIQDYLRTQPVQEILSGPEGEQRVNRAITQMAAKTFREDLVSWLDERHRITAGRAARAAFDQMQAALPDDVDEDQLRGLPRVSGADREWLRTLRQVDAGLLSNTKTATDAGATSDSLAEKLGDRITRQLRLGIQQDETVPQLARRVELVVDDGDADDRPAKGVSGQTTRSKAELIAHDSVQDAYNTAARKRYLRNGFRFVIFDATIDTKTTDLCRRMDDEVIDLLETPFFVPPLHPYCRSGIRPILKLGGRTPLAQEDVADGFLQTIFQTKSYRPPLVSEQDFQPTPLSVEHGHADPTA